MRAFSNMGAYALIANNELMHLGLFIAVTLCLTNDVDETYMLYGVCNSLECKNKDTYLVVSVLAVTSKNSTR